MMYSMVVFTSFLSAATHATDPTCHTSAACQPDLDPSASMEDIEAQEAAEAKMLGMQLLQTSVDDVEAEEEAEIGLIDMRLLQKKFTLSRGDRTSANEPVTTPTANQRLLEVSAKSDEVSKAVAETEVGTKVGTISEHSHTDSASDRTDMVSRDHNGNVCIHCSKPFAERLGGKTYTEFRTDCGNHSSPTGPTKEDLERPAIEFSGLGSRTGAKTNGFCELNFGKACADAVSNQDYLYFAKSFNVRHLVVAESFENDKRYCQFNGFLKPEYVALQHNFTGLRSAAQELCQTRYATQGIEAVSFKSVMEIQSLGVLRFEDAEKLAAWNCAMGDLACDMAMCSYSYCERAGREIGVYDECEGWDPVKGMRM